MDVSWIIAICLMLSAGMVTADLKLKPEGNEHTYFTKDNFVITCFSSGNIESLAWYGPSDNQITENIGRIHVEQSQEISESGDIQGIVLVVEKVMLEDAGPYKCLAVVDGEEQTATFNLVTLDSINFQNTKLHQYAPEGSNMTVVCNAESRSKKPVINWEYKGKQVQQDNKYHISSNELTIYDIKRSDAGNYTCAAMLISSGGSQMKSTNITVHVQHAPEWVERYPEDAYSSLGHTVNLSCEAQGEPSPSFVWKKNNETIQSNGIFTIFDEVNKTILQITVHNESLFGNYTCQASNIIKTVEKVIILKEGDTPVPPQFSVVSEEAGTLVVDIPPQADGTLLEVIGYKVEYKLSTDDWSEAQVKEFDIGHRHELKGLVPGAAYDVCVAAKNAVGYGECSAKFTVTTKSANSPTVSDNSAFIFRSSAIGLILSTTVLLWIQRL